jgi:hypothetical protein
MTFPFIAPIIICPMCLTTCPYRTIPLVGKIKAVIGQVTARSVSLTQAQWHLYKHAFVVSDCGDIGM